MAKVRIAFYKARWGDWVGMLIAGWTWPLNPTTPAYSHVEIGFQIGDKWEYFSSTTRNRSSGDKKSNGTRWITEEELLKNRDRWDVYEVELQRGRPVQDCIDLANSLLGCQYDWLGIAGFATIFGLINDKNKWYCSEVCWFVFSGQWLRRISPREMFSRIKKFDPEILIKNFKE